MLERDRCPRLRLIVISAQDRHCDFPRRDRGCWRRRSLSPCLLYDVEKTGIGGLHVRRPARWNIAPLLQLVGHFVDPGLDASLVLFTAGRA
jgi:hypothetical protein